MTDEQQKQILSTNLKRMIQRIGKEQKVIAADLDINASTFNTWINGISVPRVSEIRKLAEYFNCSITDLVNEHVPYDVAVTDKDKELLVEVHRLDTQKRAHLQSYIEYLSNSQKKDE